MFFVLRDMLKRESGYFSHIALLLMQGVDVPSKGFGHEVLILFVELMDASEKILFFFKVSQLSIQLFFDFKLVQCLFSLV
jgi:hypothetical protein